MDKISAVYQIINTVTGDRYVGSSKDVKHRWAEHKRLSTWEKYPNSLLYKDFQKYGVDKFRFQILAPVASEYLKQVEQEFIERLKPSYNDKRAKGWNVERRKETQRKLHRKYKQTEKYKEYRQSDKGKEAQIRAYKKYNHQVCLYNGELVRLGTLRQRFLRARVENPSVEAKKYILPE